MDMTAFKKWLMKSKKYGKKAAQDVVSRLKRVRKIINIDYSLTEENKVLNKLAKTKEFNNLTMSVRSQLRRAVKLLCEYNR